MHVFKTTDFIAEDYYGQSNQINSTQPIIVVVNSVTGYITECYI